MGIVKRHSRLENLEVWLELESSFNYLIRLDGRNNLIDAINYSISERVLRISSKPILMAEMLTDKFNPNTTIRQSKNYLKLKIKHYANETSLQGQNIDPNESKEQHS